MKRLFPILFMLLTVFCIGGTALAAYPDKPVTFVVGFAPGGSVDLSVRMIAERMQKELGQPIVILNKGGAGGVVGLESVVRSRPDGYTVLAGGVIPAISSSFFLKKDPVRIDSLDVVGGYLSLERGLFAPLDAPYNNWEEFVEYVRANPGKVSIGFGASQWGHEIMKGMAHKEGLQYNLVMYKSGGEASSDFFGKHIHVVDLGVGTPVYQAAREGKAKLLVGLSSERMFSFEDVPTLLELGYDWAVFSGFGFAVPKGTPEPIRAQLEAALKASVEDPNLAELMLKSGFMLQFADSKTYLERGLESERSLTNMLKYIKDNSLH